MSPCPQKIYFNDVGLAAYLLGIETPGQLSRDPLRGGLYENLLILEILKFSLNYGKRPELFFYRDTNGNEVDLVIKKEIPVFQSLGRRPRALPTN